MRGFMKHTAGDFIRLLSFFCVLCMCVCVYICSHPFHVGQYGQYLFILFFSFCVFVFLLCATNTCLLEIERREKNKSFVIIFACCGCGIICCRSSIKKGLFFAVVSSYKVSLFLYFRII